jgi:hypothetical protein
MSRSVPEIDYDRPLERGVWMQPYRSRRGRIVLVAIDRNGCWSSEHVVKEWEDAWEMAARMRQELDRADPLPDLRLVRGDHPEPAVHRMSPGAFVRMLRPASRPAR